jgi:glycosyltransferase involved in cell wall biosynthesis
MLISENMTDSLQTNSKREPFLVSIIVPLYNAVPYLYRLTENIMNQSYKRTQVIMYNDASTDDTKDVLSEIQGLYGEKIIAYNAEKNSGIGMGKNYGVEHADGQYVMFIDQDDNIEEDYIERFVESAIANPHADIIISGFKRESIDGRILYTRSIKTPDNGLRQIVPLFAKLYKKNFLITNNIRSPLGVILEDVLYQTALTVNAPKVVIIKATGYHWLENPVSASNTNLRTFKSGVAEKAFQYLESLKAHAQSKNTNDELDYGAYMFTLWHLLKTGAGVSVSEMLNERKKVFSLLDNAFPNYRSCRLITPFRPRGNRKIVSFVLWFVLCLRKLKVDKMIFIIYAKLKLSSLWPKL